MFPRKTSEGYDIYRKMQLPASMLMVRISRYDSDEALIRDMVTLLAPSIRTLTLCAYSNFMGDFADDCTYLERLNLTSECDNAVIKKLGPKLRAFQVLSDCSPSFR